MVLILGLLFELGRSIAFFGAIAKGDGLAGQLGGVAMRFSAALQERELWYCLTVQTF
jgi:hypothetical protein